MAADEYVLERAIVTRKEALDAGLKKYFNGKPCRKGHLADRHTLKANCVACQSDATAKWWRANPDRVRATFEAWIAENGEKDRAHRKEYRKATAHQRKQVAHAWLTKNKERRLKSILSWRAKNPEKVRAIKHNYRAKKAAGGSHCAEDISELLRLQKNRCAHSWCKISLKDGYHVDHVLPIAKGGTNDRKNLQILCQPCNNRKWAKHPIDYAQEHGLLL